MGKSETQNRDLYSDYPSLMPSVFKNIPVEEYTNVLQTKFGKINNLNVVYQFWVQDGFIEGESLVFLTDDVKNFSDKELREMAPGPGKTQITISKQEDFTFVNYGFRVRGGEPNNEINHN